MRSVPTATSTRRLTSGCGTTTPRRAARAIRALEGEEPAEIETPVQTTSTRRRILTGVGVIAFIGIAAVVMSFALGARLPGETITGQQSERRTTGPTVAELRAAVRNQPDDASARLALARAIVADNPNGALEQFQAAARLDPANPEPFAYSGWILRLQGFPEEALVLFDRAIEVDDRYPDVRFFKGITLLRDRNDPDGAIAQFQRYLVGSPQSPLADQVRALLAEAVGAAKADPAPGTTSTTAP